MRMRDYYENTCDDLKTEGNNDLQQALKKPEALEVDMTQGCSNEGFVRIFRALRLSYIG